MSTSVQTEAFMTCGNMALAHTVAVAVSVIMDVNKL